MHSSNERIIFKIFVIFVWNFVVWLRVIWCQEIQMMTALSGASVALPCNITPSIPGDNMTLVLWYKDDSEVPLYGLDSRPMNGSMEPEHFISDVISSRGYLNMRSHPAALEINRLYPADTGLYKCRVDFHKSRTIKQDTFLQVILPPKKPVIQNTRGHILSGTIGPFNEGDSLKLICESDSGTPPAVLKWWKGAELFQTRTISVGNGRVRSALTISRIDRDFLYSILVCEASNNNITQPPSAKVKIDLNFKPDSVAISSTKMALSAGKQTKLICQTSGSRPPATITWFLGSKQLESTEEIISEDNSYTTNILTFTPMSSDNGKNLACKSSNPLMKSNFIEDGWKLNIKYPPEISLGVKGSGDSKDIKEKEDVMFSCDINSNPKVTNVRWTFNHQPLLESNSTIANGAWLKLVKIGRDRSGTYRCYAVNDEGTGASNLLKLEVKYAPICKEGMQTAYGVSREEAARVLCSVTANPADVSFFWKFNNSHKDFNVDSYIVSNTTSTVTYVPSSSADFGNLFCWAKNTIGMQQTPCIFKVFIAEAPSSVLNCNITNITSNSVDLKCSAGSDGGLKQLFFVEVYDKLSYALRANVTAKQRPVFFIRHLSSDMTFLFVVYAANEKGRSRSVSLTSRTLSEHALRGAISQMSLSLVLSVLIGALVTIFIISLVVILWLKARRNKSKRACQKKVPSSESSSSSQMSPKEVIKEIECDFYEIKNPDIIPSRNSASDSGYSEFLMDELPIKNTNNMKELMMINNDCDTDSRLKKHKNNLRYQEPKLKPHEEEDSELFAEDTDTIPIKTVSSIPITHISSQGSLGVPFAMTSPRNIKSGKREEILGITAITPLLETTHAESAV